MQAQTTPPASPLKISSNRFAAAYRVVDDAISAHAFPGCAFGVLSANQVVLQDARGRFTYEHDASSVTPGTVFDLASVSKVVATAATVMLLHQSGRLHLDTPLSDLLPEFVAGRSGDDFARKVKLHHLLAHSSGLPGYVQFFKSVTTPSALLDQCLHLPLEAEPGTRAEYSDPGYILLGKAIEVVLQESLASWTHREIFSPLAMSSTGYIPKAEARNLIPPTEEDTWFRHRRIQGEVQDENAYVLGGVAGHAGLFSNVPDLLRFAGAILGSRIEQIPSDTRANLFASRTVELFAKRQPPEDSSRALGWDTPSHKSSSGHHFSQHSIGHLGYSGCSLWIDLDAALAVVLLTNRTWPDRECQLIRQIRPAFHDALRAALE